MRHHRRPVGYVALLGAAARMSVIPAQARFDALAAGKGATRYARSRLNQFDVTVRCLGRYGPDGKSCRPICRIPAPCSRRRVVTMTAKRRPTSSSRCEPGRIVRAASLVNHGGVISWWRLMSENPTGRWKPTRQSKNASVKSLTTARWMSPRGRRSGQGRSRLQPIRFTRQILARGMIKDPRRVVHSSKKHIIQKPAASTRADSRAVAINVVVWSDGIRFTRATFRKRRTGAATRLRGSSVLRI